MSDGLICFSKKSRWARRSGFTALVLLPMGAGWASLPRWTTYTSPMVAQSRQALSFDYPLDWQKPQVSYTTPNYVVLDITPKPPLGLSRWWLEKVRRRDFSRWGTTHVSVEIFASPTSSNLQRREQVLRAGLEQFCAQRNKTFTIHPFTHTLGPGLQVAIDSVPRGANLPEMRSRNYFVYPNGKTITGTQAQDTHAEICILCSGDADSLPEVQPMVDHIVHSIQIVPGR